MGFERNNGVLALCCFGIGIVVFLPILFTCTLKDAAKINNSVETVCHFDAIADQPSWCCQRQDQQCNRGCCRAARQNGGCSGWLSSRQKQLVNMSNATREATPCCDGGCCAEEHNECETCSRKVCSYSDSRRRSFSGSQARRGDSSAVAASSAARGPRAGRKLLQQSCRTEYYSCNCRFVCDRHSTQEETVACDKCHEYNIGMYFRIDNRTVNKTRVEQCGLTSGGFTDTSCNQKVRGEYAVGMQKSCWVDTRDMSYQWSKPGWNVGCWVGIALSSCFILLAIIGVIRMLLRTCFWVHKQELDKNTYQHAIAAHTDRKATLEWAIEQEASARMVLRVQDDSTGRQLPLHVHPSSTVKAVNERLRIQSFSFGQANYSRSSVSQKGKSMHAVGIRDGALIRVDSVQPEVQSAAHSGGGLRALSENEESLAQCIARAPKEADYARDRTSLMCLGCECKCCSCFARLRGSGVHESQPLSQSQSGYSSIPIDGDIQL